MFTREQHQWTFKVDAKFLVRRNVYMVELYMKPR